jgi:cell fate regulator YaaT (PSP1 superfamily)
MAELSVVDAERRAFYAAARERFKLRMQLNQPATACQASPDSFFVTGCGCDGCACALPDVAGGAVAAPAARVAGVRFRDSGKTYYVEPGGFDLRVGEPVVVDTSRGREIGAVVVAPHEVISSRLEGDLRPVVRVATADDLAQSEAQRERHGEAIRVFAAKIRDHRLPMKPISAEFSFDGSRLTLHFSSNGRVDFRELVRDLAGHFHCRIELRQVGPRDEARLLGGLGRCGRPLCCSTWLPQFADVTMTMARTQDLSNNPSKVSGVCGKLLCCLSYENDQYADSRALLPRLGQRVQTAQGPGYVHALQILKEHVVVRLESGDEVVVEAEQLTAIGGVPDDHPYARRRRPRRDTAEEQEPQAPPTLTTEA